MLKQRTLKTVIRATGVGVHTGQKVFLTLKPAPVNSGITFVRTDLATPVAIKATAENVGDTSLSTCLVKDGVRISTIEHLLSAFAGLGIDNAIVEVTAPEIPIMDGSAGPFIFLIRSAGIAEQDAAKRFVRIKKPVEVTDSADGKVARLSPYDGLKFTVRIEYDHPAFDTKNQEVTLDFSSTAYVKEISRARTYGFLSEFEFLRSRNLALGASLDNSIAIDEYQVMNQDGLRFADECARHKVLDAIGDMYMIGHPLIGAFYGYKCGHALNNHLLHELKKQPDTYEIVEFDEESDSPFAFIEAFA